MIVICYAVSFFYYKRIAVYYIPAHIFPDSQDAHLLKISFPSPQQDGATTGAIRIERKAITQPSTCTHTWGHIRAVVGQGFVLHHGANEGRLRERET